jgi:site-specific recombinase XerC
VPGSRLPAGRNVEHDELTALLAVCAADPRPAGARDGAIIALAYLSGGRRAELAGLHVANIDLDPPAIRVVGKTARSAWCPSPPPTPLIEGWLAWRGDHRARCSARSTEATTSSTGVRLAAKPSARSWATEPGRRGPRTVSPDLRRSYARDPLDVGADLPAVQQLLGHACPATTSRYDRRRDTARRTSAERLHIEIPSNSNEPDSSG